MRSATFVASAYGDCSRGLSEWRVSSWDRWLRSAGAAGVQCLMCSWRLLALQAAGSIDELRHPAEAFWAVSGATRSHRVNKAACGARPKDHLYHALFFVIFEIENIKVLMMRRSLSGAKKTIINLPLFCFSLSGRKRKKKKRWKKKEKKKRKAGWGDRFHRAAVWKVLFNISIKVKKYRYSAGCRAI